MSNLRRVHSGFVTVRYINQVSTSGTRHEAEEGDGEWPRPEARSRARFRSSLLVNVMLIVVQMQDSGRRRPGRGTRAGSREPSSPSQTPEQGHLAPWPTVLSDMLYGPARP